VITTASTRFGFGTVRPRAADRWESGEGTGTSLTARECGRFLKAVWEVADYPWSVRLKARLPEGMAWIRRFRLSTESERPMLPISARSLDRRLRGEQRKRRRRLEGGAKPGTLLTPRLPLKTDHGDVQVPGFTEIDRVSHSADSASGSSAPR